MPGRFCEPAGELHIEEAWYPPTALPEMQGVKVEQVYVRRLHETPEVLCGCKEPVEKHLKNRLGELFTVDCDLLLYNVTSTCFEGEASRSPQAKRGYSRGKRAEAAFRTMRPQLCLRPAYHQLQHRVQAHRSLFLLVAPVCSFFPRLTSGASATRDAEVGCQVWPLR